MLKVTTGIAILLLLVDQNTLPRASTPNKLKDLRKHSGPRVDRVLSSQTPMQGLPCAAWQTELQMESLSGTLGTSLKICSVRTSSHLLV